MALDLVASDYVSYDRAVSLTGAENTKEQPQNQFPPALMPQHLPH